MTKGSSHQTCVCYVSRLVLLVLLMYKPSPRPRPSPPPPPPPSWWREPPPEPSHLLPLQMAAIDTHLWCCGLAHCDHRRRAVAPPRASATVASKHVRPPHPRAYQRAPPAPLTCAASRTRATRSVKRGGPHARNRSRVRKRLTTQDTQAAPAGPAHKLGVGRLGASMHV